MLIRTDTLVPWKGEALQGLRHPKNIEKLWTVEELAAVGLVKAIAFVIPQDWRATGPSTWDVNGVETRPIEVIPPLTPEEIEAQQVADMDRVFSSHAVKKLIWALGKEQGMWNSLTQMRAWVDSQEDPPA